METLILCVCLVALMSCLTVVCMAGIVLWKGGFSPAAKKEEQIRMEITEDERAAAKAQRVYEQAFADMMRYDGSPRKREERVQF